MKNETILQAMQELNERAHLMNYYDFYGAARGLMGQITVAPTERKIVQIAQNEHTVTALCNDGSVWVFYNREWVSLAPIPQGEA